jgi:hypothetical protein
MGMFSFRQKVIFSNFICHFLAPMDVQVELVILDVTLISDFYL